MPVLRAAGAPSGGGGGEGGRGRRVDESTFTRDLRFEVASEEGRALVISYLVAVTLGIVWLLLVHLLPAVPPQISLMREEETRPIEVEFEQPPAPAAPEAAAPAPSPGPPARSQQPRRDDAAAIGDAFGGSTPDRAGALVGDVSNVLRGVDVNRAGSAPAGSATTGGKAVIAYGQGGQGSRTPGRGGFGTGLDSGATGGIGGVRGGGGVGRATVSVTAPSVVRAENIGGPGRNVQELGSFVRGRQSQLRFCYEENGLKVNPNLAGTVTVAVTMTGSGDVTGVSIVRRTWSGAGADATESCIRSRISSWRFPPSDAGGGTFNFPFNFTR
ncbi:MAG TPA: AgmX/PglI C-terminal domain-containing protein [Gemmatimonadaceae bacterium]|nr:AgmX/PglI C-terminal domain-containing protein [Gemmatimonadaceae bacterium]